MTYICKQCAIEVPDLICPGCDQITDISLGIRDFLESHLSLPPIPAFIPEWYTAINCAWGDTLAALGIIQYFMGQLGQKTCKIIYYGYDPAIEEFLRQQPWIDDVIHITPSDSAEYQNISHLACTTSCSILDNHTWLSIILKKHPEVDFSTVYASHIDNGMMRSYRPILPTNIVLPKERVKWANDWLKSNNIKKFVILNPLSEQSELAALHWKHWKAAVQWLLEEYPQTTFVLVGLRQTSGKAPNLIDLTGQTPSNMEVLALVNKCEALISTGNNLAIWNLMAKKPNVVTCNCSMRFYTNFFRRLIDRNPTHFIGYWDSLEDFKNEVRGLGLEPPK